VTLLVRMIGDGVDAVSWIRWTSPFGLLALVRPYADDLPGRLGPAGGPR
jgi:ABC-2 type transport system permease protein